MIAHRRLLLSVVLLVGFPSLALADGRLAGRVVFRGARQLEHALRIATYEAWRDPAQPHPVAIVIDATAFTAFARADLETALIALDARVGEKRASWRLGRLGDRLTYAGRGPAPLARRLGNVLSRDSSTTSTIDGLRRTLSQFRAVNGVVVYIADRHFEDHAGLEDFIAELTSRGQRFSVVGPEAGFGQPYDDTCYLSGRSPFDSTNETAPWHTGDTAWPHLPGRMRVGTWSFHEPLAYPEELAPLLRAFARAEHRGQTPDREALLKHLESPGIPRIAIYSVVPSSFGPYGLMRACAETGGTYCLWSWNPIARPGAAYEYGRCNHYAPDLRSRAAIRADLVERPLVRALLRAWEIAASRNMLIVHHTPPARKDGVGQAMSVTLGVGLPNPWYGPQARAAFMQGMSRRLDGLDQAVAALEGAIAIVNDPDAVDRRYRADAELLRHILRLERFQQAEKRDAFLAFESSHPTVEHPDRITFQGQTWVRGGPSPDTLRLGDLHPYDLVTGRQMLAAHRQFLERYVGTPYAELVSRNRIHTCRIVPRSSQSTRPGGRGPSSSREHGPKAPVTPGPGGSTGGGPATGR